MEKGDIAYIVGVYVGMTDNIRRLTDMTAVGRTRVELHSRRVKVRSNAGQVLEYVELVPSWAFDDLPLV